MNGTEHAMKYTFLTSLFTVFSSHGSVEHGIVFWKVTP